MPVDPSAAMASNMQSQNALQAMNPGQPANIATPDQFYAAQGIKPINTHPEAIAEGAMKGLQSAIGSIAGAYAGGAGQAASAAQLAGKQGYTPTQTSAGWGLSPGEGE